MSNKLPIPRLVRDRLEGQRRTGRACDACRQRKVKCDGAKPACSQCHAQGLTTCVYSETKIEERRKQVESQKAKIDVYEKLLRDIYRRVEASIANQIEGVLQNPLEENARLQRSSGSSSSSVGSLDEIDTVDEDLNRSDESRATGYMGKSSEITWMHRLERQTKEQRDNPDFATNRPQPEVPTGEPISSVNYRLDHDPLSHIKVGNAFILPPKSLSNQLLYIYLEKVHDDLPLIRKGLFIEQHRLLFSGGRVNPGSGWLAVFNMILAIASRFCKVSELEIQDEPDENVFFARAKSLNLSENIGYDHEDLQQVQAEVLVAFYFFTVSQINRSWKMVGIAARAGVALGLHLRGTDDQNDIKSGEARKRLWWSIFHLEQRLSIMTGRVSCVGCGSCTARPPLPFGYLGDEGPVIGQPGHQLFAQAHELQWTISQRDEQLNAQQRWLKSIAPNPSLYFFYLMDLTLIAHDVSNRVYTPDAVGVGWSQIKTRIEFYSKKLDQWLESLHPSMVVEDNDGHLLPQSSSHHQVSLALNYYSARIVLNRPCLTRPGGERSGSRSLRSQFNNDTASNCLRASLALIAVLPDQPDSAWAYNVSPWWSLLPFLMQATIALLIDMSIGVSQEGTAAETSKAALGIAESTEVVLAATGKALRWLHTLGRTEDAAARAFKLCYSCFQQIASSQGLDLSGMPFSSIQPNPAIADVYHVRQPILCEPMSLPTQQQKDGGEEPVLSELTGSESHGYGLESDSSLFQDVQTSTNSSQNLFPPSVSNTSMSEDILHPSDATLEDILLSAIGYNT